MRRSVIRNVSSLSLVVVLAGLAPLAAVAADSYQLYRYQVLGDSAARPTVSVPANAETVLTQVPGPNAGHLIFLGVSPDVAIAQARSKGEEPTTRLVTRERQIQLTGAEAHERYVGRTPVLGTPVHTAVADSAR